MSVLDSVKGLANMVKEIGDIDLNRKIIDLQSEVFELLEENYEIKNEICDLKDLKETHEKLKFKNNMYYLIDSDNEDGPYCSSCWDQNTNLIRMHENDIGHLCPICIRKK